MSKIREDSFKPHHTEHYKGGCQTAPTREPWILKSNTQGQSLPLPSYCLGRAWGSLQHLLVPLSGIEFRIRGSFSSKKYTLIELE